jgi:hypothetical protein
MERAAGEGAVVDGDAAEEGAEDDALAKSRQCRAATERPVPHMSKPSRPEAKLEGKAAENQGEEHQNERHVEGRQQNGVGDRECGDEKRAAEHQPRLVAVPDRRDRVHHEIAVGIARGEREQDADAEIETIHHDIHRDAERHHEAEQERQIHRRHSAGDLAGADPIPGRTSAGRSAGSWIPGP